MFLIQVFHQIDMDRVLNGSPWTFNNHLLVLRRLKLGEDPLKVPLEHVMFWVQIHDIPLGFFRRCWIDNWATLLVDLLIMTVRVLQNG